MTGSWSRCWAGAIGTLVSVSIIGCATGQTRKCYGRKERCRNDDDPLVAEHARAALRDAEETLVQVE